MALPNLNKYNLKDLTQFKIALTQAYNHFNRKYFRNRLPLVEFTNVGKWSHQGGYVRMLGYTDRLILGINPGLRGKQFEDTLLHEMCHIAQLTFDAKASRSALTKHGSAWKSWMRKVGLDPEEHTFIDRKTIVDQEVKDYVKSYKGDKDLLTYTDADAVRYIHNKSQFGIIELICGVCDFKDTVENTDLVEGLVVFIPKQFTEDGHSYRLYVPDNLHSLILVRDDASDKKYLVPTPLGAGRSRAKKKKALFDRLLKGYYTLYGVITVLEGVKPSAPNFLKALQSAYDNTFGPNERVIDIDYDLPRIRVDTHGFD